jgi:three-Cys-motif partner protein
VPEEFFQHRREWSRWKHRLLQRFLGQFAGIVGSTHKRVYYVDGFAGEGRYKDPPEDGSPVIAAKIAADDTIKRSYQLRCINVEPDHYKALCESTSEFPSTLVANLEGTFQDNLDAILKETGNDPALFFLDPMGHVGMEWDVVKRLAARSRDAITDVLLNFYITSIDRHAGFLRSTDVSAQAFVRRLDALFGTAEWQQVWTDTPNQTERIIRLSDLYMGRLLAAFSSSSSQSVTARYPVRTIEGDLKYYLMFGTRHIRGGRAMSEAVFRVSLEYDKACVIARNAARAKNPQVSIFGPEPEPNPDEIDRAIATKLASDIRQNVQLNKSFSLDDLEELLLPRWFGQAIQKHYLQACESLVNSGLATVPPREKRRKSMTGKDRITLKSRGN